LNSTQIINYIQRESGEDLKSHNRFDVYQHLSESPMRGIESSRLSLGPSQVHFKKLKKQNSPSSTKQGRYTLRRMVMEVLQWNQLSRLPARP